MLAVLIIPTGIGCEIGGHAGDANPVAKLIGSVCDTLILHPNVVNASDINEMPENALYVEGSMLDRFLRGEISLKRVKYNKILLVVNSPIRNQIINAASAAKATIGADIQICVLDEPLRMIATMDGEKASGEVYGWQKLVKQVNEYDFDALAISTVIDCSAEIVLEYFRNGGVNPWGAVEAIASHFISDAINKPVAHAPLDSLDNSEELRVFDDVVDARLAAEIVSVCYAHCIFKGLHKAPQIADENEWNSIDVGDVDVMISPYGCVGEPHWACMEAKIPIIVVKENKTVLNDPIPDDFIVVDDYWAAAGWISCMRAGIAPESVRRPLKPVEILNLR